MFNPTSYGSTQIDPTTQRILEQLAFVVNDAEQRLFTIKTTLAQVLPSIGPYGAQAYLGLPSASALLSPSPIPIGFAPWVSGMANHVPILSHLAAAPGFPPVGIPGFAGVGLGLNQPVAGVNAPLSPITAAVPGLPFRLG